MRHARDANMIQIRQLDLTFGAPQASAPTVQNVPEHRSEPSRLERSEGMGNLPVGHRQSKFFAATW